MKRKILFVVEDKKSAQFRYRVENIIQALDKSKKIEADYCLKDGIDKIDFSEIKTLIILRQAAKDGIVLKLIREARRAGVKILFDLDDLIFDYRDLLLLMWSTKSKNIFYWAGYFWGIRRIAKKVDGFLTTNKFLAKKIERSFKKPVKVIRNSLSQQQIKEAEKIVKEKTQKIAKSFTIGYFSGSPTHAKDLKMVELELLRFLKTHENVFLKVVGEMKFSRKMQKMIETGRIKITRKVDYLKLLNLMAEVDVNIAPLVINDFTNCKSELKFFEAGVVETTTIASPSYTFSRAIKDGQNGFLAQPGEWFDKLEYLYTHPEENKKIAKVAKKYALKHYYGADFLKEIEKAYEFFAK